MWFGPERWIELDCVDRGVEEESGRDAGRVVIQAWKRKSLTRQPRNLITATYCSSMNIGRPNFYRVVLFRMATDTTHTIFLV
jgi:hypothetical protein